MYLEGLASIFGVLVFLQVGKVGKYPLAHFSLFALITTTRLRVRCLSTRGQYLLSSSSLEEACGPPEQPMTVLLTSCGRGKQNTSRVIIPSFKKMHLRHFVYKNKGKLKDLH